MHKYRLTADPVAPPETLILLATDETQSVGCEIAHNPNTPPKTLPQLFTNLTILFLSVIPNGVTSTYNATCVLVITKIPEIQMCQVVEHRTPSGTLQWRNIYARTYSVRSWFGPKGLTNKDSLNKKPYPWQYVANRQGYSAVSPKLNVHNIAWD